MSKVITNKVGMKFGLLKVMSKTAYRALNGSYYYECSCDCGTICYIASSNLQIHTPGSKRQVSCGCVGARRNKVKYNLEELKMAKTYVTKLKYVRLSKGYSIKEVSEKLQVSQNQYTKWEEGTSTPSRIKKEYLGDFFGVNYKKLFAKFQVDTVLIDDLESKVNSVDSMDLITVPWHKAERLKRDITQKQLAEAIDISTYTISVLEKGQDTLHIKTALDARKKLAAYFKVTIDELIKPVTISSELENKLRSKNIEKAIIATKQLAMKKKSAVVNRVKDEITDAEIDEMSGPEVREFAKRAVAQNRSYEEEVIQNKKLISEIQASNSENISYKEKYEKLLVETEGNAKVAKLARDLFMELSLGN